MNASDRTTQPSTRWGHRRGNRGDGRRAHTDQMRCPACHTRGALASTGSTTASGTGATNRHRAEFQQAAEKIMPARNRRACGDGGGSGSWVRTDPQLRTLSTAWCTRMLRGGKLDHEASRSGCSCGVRIENGKEEGPLDHERGAARQEPQQGQCQTEPRATAVGQDRARTREGSNSKTQRARKAGVTTQSTDEKASLPMRGRRVCRRPPAATETPDRPRAAVSEDGERSWVRQRPRRSARR